MNSITATKPRLLVIAGPNGAGKITVTEQGCLFLLDHYT
jgi:predicted ABC-type ATPase